MTKQTEALKLALEALVSSTGELHLRLASPTDMQLIKNHKAITALRKALTSEEIGQPAQQEPVAWISTGSARMIHWTSDKPAYGDDWIPLYTTPAQRTWVGLTDEQIGKAWAVADGEHNASASVKRRITRAIEAAHGITGETE